MKHVAYIGLGSNLGGRRKSIHAAVDALRAEEGIFNIDLSSLHETEPVGGPDGQENFLNAAAMIETILSADALFELMQEVENQLGRQRLQHWGPRTIDLDLLLFDDEVIRTSNLVIPHPRMHERMFVLAPLVEIGPRAVHPIIRKSVTELFRELSN